MPRECENARPLSSWYNKLCIALRCSNTACQSPHPSRPYKAHSNSKPDLDLRRLELAELVLHEALEVLVHELEHEEELAVLLQAVQQTRYAAVEYSTLQ